MKALLITAVTISGVIGASVPAQEQHVLGAGDYALQFAGEKVLRCAISSADRNARLLADGLRDYVISNNLDMWSDVISLDSFIDIRIERVKDHEKLLSVSGWNCREWIGDLAALVADQMNSASEGDGGDFYGKWHSFDELIDRVKSLVAEYPKLAYFVPSIGKSWEGRDLSVVHITGKSDASKRKRVWIDGGIHAREWISSHIAVYMIENLLKNYGKDDRVTRILDTIEFVIAPHINPDGFEYSRLKNRFWRKNRRDNNDGTFGVDLNRNFDVKWADGGSSRVPRSDTYRGPSPASEPETQACQKYLSGLENVVVGFDLHSYSQLIMRPYGFSFDTHPTEPMNKALGDGMSDVIKNTTGAVYKSQKSATLYPVSGGFDDWMTINGIIGYTIENRDTGRYGFVLPAGQILPNCQEIFEATKFMGEFVIEQVPSRS